jgi:intracellular sulfur oxidation DsrE/DsrF family protein
MKRMVSLLVLLLFGFGFTQSQDHPYRVVFDLTSRDSLDQQAVLRWVREITGSNPEAELEVVMYGKGIEMAVKGKSPVADRLRDAAKNPRVSFKVCQVALRSNKVGVSQLVDGVQTVPDGVYEIISKQREGWGYIKVGH